MKKRWRQALWWIAALVGMLCVSGCTAERENECNVEVSGIELILDYEEELQYATKFTLTRYQDGYSSFQIPEVDSEKLYLIIPEGKAVPENLPEHTVLLQQPITKICFASGSLASLAEALGAVECITTVAIERDGWILDSVREGLDSGEILYSGKFREPDFELLLTQGIQLEIDTTMLLNYPDIRAKYDELKIPYFIENSTQEEHPLGRMEWVKVLGAILGLDQEAKEWFDAQAAKVEAMHSEQNSPKTAALFYIGENDTVYVRNASDYIPSMLQIAGGSYCMKDMLPDSGGTSKFGFEDFYAACKDADYLFWIVLACPYDTLEELIGYNELFTDFKAVQNKTVYSSQRGFAQNTAELASVIEEMNQILNDSGIEKTKTFVKLK